MPNRTMTLAEYDARRAIYTSRARRRTLAACLGVALVTSGAVGGVLEVSASSPPTQREQIQVVVDAYASRHVPALRIECRATVCVAYNRSASVAVVVVKRAGIWTVRSGVA